MTPLYVDIDALTSKYNSKIDNALGKLDSFADSAQRIGSRLTLTLTAPLLLAANKMKNLASDFEESVNKIDVVFGDSAQTIKDWSKTTLTAYGIASGSALDMSAYFGDMASSMGYSEEVASDMSRTLVGLAGDMASFKNIRLDVANTALSAIFTGETESLKSLGIVMTQMNLEQFAMENGLNANIQSMNEAERVALRYAFVLDKTKNAQGDFIRTGGGAANQTRIFHESLKELGQSFGAIILPYFTKGITVVNQIIASFNNLDENVKRNILIGGGIVAAVGPALLAFSSVAKAVKTIGITLGTMTAPVSVFAALMAASAAYVLTHWDKVKHRFMQLDIAFASLVTNIDNALVSGGLMSKEYAAKDIANAWSNVARWVDETGGKTSTFTEELKKAQLELQKILDGIKDNGVGGGNAVKRLFAGVNISPLKGIESSIGGDEGNKKLWEDYFKKQIKIAELMAETGFDFKGVGERMKSHMDSVIQSIPAPDMSKFTQDYVNAIRMSSEIMAQATQMSFGFLADTLATGLASVFNQEVKFDFKRMLGQFLSAVGSMFVQMATPMLAGLTFANIASGGALSAQQTAGLKFLGVGIAMKAGGAAISASAPSSSVGGGYNQGGYGSGYGTTFSPNITATFGGTVQVVADGTQLKGVLDSTNVRYNG